MNADRFLAHYERIADAPDAISRMRQFILDLAARGKLVEQNPADEPASELLKRIEAEKARLVKTGEIRKQPEFFTLAEIERAFDIPANWEWIPATYPAYGVSDLGKKVKTKDILEIGAFPVVDQGKVLVRGFSDDRDKVIRVERPLVLFGDHAREIKLIDFDFVVGADGVKLLQPVIVFEGFYFLVLQWLPLDSRGYGRHFRLLKASNIPLPPLAEQHRIVAKVDELMALCDRLEAARADRETTRDRLMAASLARLDAPDPDPATFRVHAVFALDNLAPLTACPDQVKAVRQTILNLAVRGKLVEQNPADEPALELLKRIAKEKARLVKAGKIKKPKIIPTIPGGDAPFPLPANWQWSQIADIGVLSPRNDADDHVQSSFIPMPLVASEYGLAVKHKVRRWGEIKRGYTHFAEGDVGLAKITPCFENGKSTIFRNLTGRFGSGTTELHIVRPLFVDPDYILIFLKCPHFIESGIPKMTGTAGQKRVPTEYFACSPFPLPPLAEQHRIVAKVNELLALCGQLETALTTADATRVRLLEALLHEALGTAEEREAAA